VDGIAAVPLAKIILTFGKKNGPVFAFQRTTRPAHANYFSHYSIFKLDNYNYCAIGGAHGGRPARRISCRSSRGGANSKKEHPAGLNLELCRERSDEYGDDRLRPIDVARSDALTMGQRKTD
jgi:hypothetical protein